VNNDLKMQAWDELFKQLKSEWRAMWLERFDDRIAAEGVAVQDYSLLSLGRGTVVVATRSYKAPDFREILEEQRKVLGVARVSGYEHPSVGDWGKYVRSNFGGQSLPRRRRVAEFVIAGSGKSLQKKKGGRCWVHRF
jgi:hypothetical protein